VAGSWRSLHNEELHNLYASTNIISVIKPTRMRWAGHVTRMGAMWNAYKILKGRDDSEDLGVDGKIILESILGKYVDWMHLAQNRDKW